MDNSFFDYESDFPESKKRDYLEREIPVLLPIGTVIQSPYMKNNVPFRVVELTYQDDDEGGERVEMLLGFDFVRTIPEGPILISEFIEAGWILA